jgi:hypothetical protein
MILGFCERNVYVLNVFECHSEVYVDIGLCVLLPRNDKSFLNFTQFKMTEVMYFTPAVQIHWVI